VLIEQTTAVSTDRLGDSAGRLNASELRSLDEALAVVFGF
jgi:mRNA-degrading endonuclease toxin of MazEF toxin-antitoxin module